MRAQFVLSEIGIGLRRNLTMTIAVITTTTIALMAFGGGLLLQKQVSKMKSYWYDKVEVSVFLCVARADVCAGPVTQSQRDELNKEISTNPLVKQVFYESQEEAYTRFKEQFKDSPDLVKNTSATSLPESFRVKLKDPKQSEIFVSSFQDRPGVSDVVDARKVLGKLFQILNVLQRAAWGFAIVLVFVATLLISNTIRVSAFNRRRETGIMRLVGASNFYIQLPFLLEGAIAGAIGAAIAGGLLLLFQGVVITHNLRNIQALSAFQLTTIGDVWVIIPWLLVGGVLLSGLASFLTLRRYLRV